MPLSRLRLRLAWWFALAFTAGLLFLSLALFVYMRHQSDRRFTRALDLAAGQLLGAVRLEYAEAPDAGLAGRGEERARGVGSTGRKRSGSTTRLETASP